MNHLFQNFEDAKSLAFNSLPELIVIQLHEKNQKGFIFSSAQRRIYKNFLFFQGDFLSILSTGSSSFSV